MLSVMESKPEVVNRKRPKTYRELAEAILELSNEQLDQEVLPFDLVNGDTLEGIDLVPRARIKNKIICDAGVVSPERIVLVSNINYRIRLAEVGEE